MTGILYVALAAALAVAVSGQAGSLLATNYDAGDHGRSETVLPDGTVKGQYSYTDADGKRYTVKYRAGRDGYHVEGDHLPQPPPGTPTYAPRREEQQQVRQNQLSNDPEDDGTYDPNNHLRYQYNPENEAQQPRRNVFRQPQQNVFAQPQFQQQQPDLDFFNQALRQAQRSFSQTQGQQNLIIPRPQPQQQPQPQPQQAPQIQIQQQQQQREQQPELQNLIPDAGPNFAFNIPARRNNSPRQRNPDIEERDDGTYNPQYHEAYLPRQRKSKKNKIVIQE